MAPAKVDYNTRAGNIFEWVGDESQALKDYVKLC